MDQTNQNIGFLIISVTTNQGFLPIKDATIEIASTGEPNTVLATYQTDESGLTPLIRLEAPPLSYSMTPTDNQPYAEYNIKVSAYNYDMQLVTGIQIFEGETALQKISLTPLIDTFSYNPIVIGGHVLFEYYPPKIAEPEIKPITDSGEIVLRKVVVPETIVVHDGAPTDSSATNYYVSYADYIKNVASCEIYATWPTATIEANVLAIMSFTLNRVYTEWYRNKNYSFTITSSTAFDHKWIYGKTIYESISQAVDRLYGRYLAKPNVKQPILTQYCDGKRVSCPNWMTQWGSKALGDDGLSTLDILRYYYGSEMYIATAEVVSGIPSSYPGYDLAIGSSGDAVLQIQEQLARISKAYPALPSISADGIFGPRTKEAVQKFQQVFNLPANGIVDYPTWYKISQIYVGVSKIAENV